MTMVNLRKEQGQGDAYVSRKQEVTAYRIPGCGVPVFGLGFGFVIGMANCYWPIEA